MIAIAVAFGITPRAGVAVPIPGAAHAIARFQHMGRKPEAIPQAMELIHASEAGTDDQRVIKLGVGRGGGQGGYGIKHGGFFWLFMGLARLAHPSARRQAGQKLVISAGQPTWGSDGVAKPQGFLRLLDLRERPIP